MRLLHAGWPLLDYICFHNILLAKAAAVTARWGPRPRIAFLEGSLVVIRTQLHIGSMLRLGCMPTDTEEQILWDWRAAGAPDDRCMAGGGQTPTFGMATKRA